MAQPRKRNQAATPGCCSIDSPRAQPSIVHAATSTTTPEGCSAACVGNTRALLPCTAGSEWSTHAVVHIITSWRLSFRLHPLRAPKRKSQLACATNLRCGGSQAGWFLSKSWRSCGLPIACSKFAMPAAPAGCGHKACACAKPMRAYAGWKVVRCWHPKKHAAGMSGLSKRNSCVHVNHAACQSQGGS